MEKEFNELSDALKGIIKIKDLMIERFYEKEENNLNVVESLNEINKRLQEMHSSTLNHLYKTGDFKDKQFIFDKLIQYRGFDSDLEKQFMKIMQKNEEVKDKCVISRINEKIEEVKSVLDEFQAIKEIKHESNEFGDVRELISQGVRVLGC
jgi:heterodisulfide reductase subunit C